MASRTISSNSGSSATRWTVRIVLVLVLVGLLWIGYRSQIRSRPDFHWSKAQAALKADNLNAAKIHLQNMIQRFPQDSRGHEAMAALLVKEAKLPDGPDGYAAHPGALNLLVEAGKLREEDLELQKLLVSAALRAGRAQDAAVAAQRVLKAEPKHVDSLYARAVRAADSRDAAAALRFLDQMPVADRDTFRSQGLRAQVIQDRDPKDPKLQEALESIATRAGKFNAEDVKALPSEEVNILGRLLPAAVNSAADAGAAYRRAEVALSIAEKLQAGSEKQADAGKTMIAQVSAILNAKFPALTLSADMQLAQQRFSERLTKVLPSSAPVGKGQKTQLIVAHEAALLKFNKGEFAAAVEIVEHALTQQKSNKRARPAEAQPLHLLAARALLGLRRHREAKVHLASLVNDKQTSGIGQLMLGAVASAEGRQQDALGHFIRSERDLGDNPLVTISLAQTHLALAQWEEALSHLAALHEKLASDDVELQAWAKQQQFTEARIHLQEARALLALKRKTDAEKHLLALTGTELEPQAALLEADYQAGQNDLAGADRILAQSLQKFPHDASLVASRAAILKRLNRTADLTALLASSSASNPDDLRMQLMIARELVRSDKHDEALAALATLEQKHPTVIPLLLLKADALMQQGKMAEAQAVVEHIQRQPDAGLLGGMLSAVVALRAKDPQAAAAALKASSQESPDNLQVRHLEGELAAVSGDFPAAIAALGESVRVTSLRGRAGPLLCYCIAKLAEAQGPAAAEAAITPLVTSSPDEPFVLIAHSDVLAMQGKFTASLKQLDRLEEIEKQSALPPYLKGVVLSRTGDLPAALIEAKRAMALDAKYVPAQTIAAQLQLSLKNHAEALQNINTALGLAPEAWNLAVLKTEILWGANQKSEAVNVARALTVKTPELVEARRHLVSLQLRDAQPAEMAQGLIDCRAAREKFSADDSLAVQEVLLLQLLGKTDESWQQAQQYVGEPVQANKALVLAQGFGQVQQLLPARQWAESALAVAKPEESSAIRRFLGMIMMSQHAAGGDRKLLEQARDQFVAVLEKEPQDFISGNNLAWLLAVDFNQPAEAVKIAERARSNASIDRLPITFIDTMAVVYRRAGEFQKATSLLESALSAHPEENLLKFHLGLTLGQVNRADEAKQLLTEALAGKLSPQQTIEAQQEIKRLRELEAAAAAAEAAAGTKAAGTKAAEDPQALETAGSK